MMWPFACRLSIVSLKPTIYRFQIALSDLNRDVFDTLSLTVARHPSETAERMLVRVLAYCMNLQEGLTFTRGLSSPDEADVWAHTLHNSIKCWIEVGEPAVERIKKATRQSPEVKVYCFNSKAGVWYTQNREQLAQLDAAIYRFAWSEVQAFAALLERTMDLTLTLSGESAYINTGQGDCEVTWETLQAAPATG